MRFRDLQRELAALALLVAACGSASSSGTDSGTVEGGRIPEAGRSDGPIQCEQLATECGVNYAPSMEACAGLLTCFAQAGSGTKCQCFWPLLCAPAKRPVATECRTVYPDKPYDWGCPPGIGAALSPPGCVQITTTRFCCDHDHY
jgi:hypothetical protein